MTDRLYDDSPETIADVCEETAALLEGQWTKGRWRWGIGAGNYSYCLEGGLMVTLGVNIYEAELDHHLREKVFDSPVIGAIKEVLMEQCEDFNPAHRLAGWNDEDETTEQDVLDLLHATAKHVLGVEG